MVQAELKSKIERTDEGPVRKIPIAERAARYQAQQRKLRGMVLEDELECSDALVDEAMAQFEENRRRYIAWERCTKRNNELRGIKKETSFQTTSQGLLKATSAPVEARANLASDLLLKSALQRRGLAYDQANLLEFDLHNLLVEKLFKCRLKEQPHGYAQISYAQLHDADVALFHFLADHCRSGIVPDALGVRPLDTAIRLAMVDPEVVQLLLPLPSHSSSHKRAAPGIEAQSTDQPSNASKNAGKAANKAKPKQKPKGAGKGKAKNDKKGKSARLPAGLEGASVTPGGVSICFNFNFKKCTSAPCAKGEHVCTKCFGPHAFMDCNYRTRAEASQ
jgi:hypothetical protein